jgi:hypothetical protein
MYVCGVKNLAKLAYWREVDKLNCGLVPYVGCFYNSMRVCAQAV